MPFPRDDGAEWTGADPVAWSTRDFQPWPFFRSPNPEMFDQNFLSGSCLQDDCPILRHKAHSGARSGQEKSDQCFSIRAVQKERWFVKLCMMFGDDGVMFPWIHRNWQKGWTWCIFRLKPWYSPSCSPNTNNFDPRNTKVAHNSVTNFCNWRISYLWQRDYHPSVMNWIEYQKP